MYKWSYWFVSMQILDVFSIIYFSPSNTCVALFHCVFNLHFPMVNEVGHLFVCLFAAHKSSLVKSLCPYFYWVFVFLLLISVGTLYM